jgi:fatty-acyl-CoA synthase
VPDGPRSAARARFARAAAHLHPLRVYERCEAATALMFAASPTPQAPHRLWLAIPELWRWRNNPAGIVTAGAKRYPRRLALVDDEQALTFAELDRQTNALASEWRRAGIGAGTTIGLLARNRAAFVEAFIAGHKLGAHLVFLNTSFAAPQVVQVVTDEEVDVLVHDDDLGALAEGIAAERRISGGDLRRAVAVGDQRPFEPPPSAGRVVVLTSGTTGRPRGASRHGSGNPLDAAAMLTTIPLISGDTAVIPAPLFHGLGLFAASFSLALGSTVVLAPRFDPERTLDDVQRHSAHVLVVVPVMLQRILELEPSRLDQYDLSSLRVIMCGGAQLPGWLARDAMDRFGEILYNIYGSTEVALATVATPRDLRAAPGTAGRPLPGVGLRIVDDAGRPVGAGGTGRIFVGSSLRFDGYTDGGYKPMIDGFVSTGDVGRMDRTGRLFLEGREDEMIVSGGENVFPAEIEEVLGQYPGVAEVAVLGVPDDEFGQRLRAFVVEQEPGSLNPDKLRAYVRENLARFKTPRDVVFLDRLPRTATGKVIKRELRRYDDETDHTRAHATDQTEDDATDQTRGMDTSVR